MIAAAPSALRTENHRLLADDLRLRRALPESLPTTLRIDTTSACRLSCLHCFKPSEPEGRVMPSALYRRLATELFPVIDTVELGCDGEPLHDPHFAERLDAIDETDGPRLDLTTSGDGLEEWISAIVPRARRLTISIETLDPSLYPVVRKGAQLPRLLRAVERFRGTADRLPPERRPVLAFRLTLFGGNHATLPTLVSQLASAGADSIDLQHGIALPDSHDDLQMTDHVMDLGVALQRAVLQGDVCGVDVHYPKLSPRPAWTDSEVGRRADGLLPHHAAWTRASIDPAGMVAICCNRDRLSMSPTAQLGDGGFQAAWQSEPLQGARRPGTRVPACGWCPHAEDPVHGK